MKAYAELLLGNIFKLFDLCDKNEANELFPSFLASHVCV